MADEAVEPQGGGAAVATPEVIEPPPGAGVPIDTQPPAPADKKDSPSPDPAKPTDAPKVKLPTGVKPPVKTGRFQQRISDLVGQRDATERENAQLRERLSRMQSVPKPGAKGEAGAEGKNGAPVAGEGLNPDDFPTYGEYVAAVVKQTMDQREAAAKSQQANAAYEEHKQERMSVFNEQAAPLAQEYGDGFWDAITDPSLPISEAMADAVLELDELGPYTMLYLAANKQEAAKIARMNPRAATIAIGRLAAKLDYDIKQGGDGTGSAGGGAAPESGQPQSPAPAPAPAQKPSHVPVPRGSVPALNNEPNDKDDVDTWLKKESDRMRRMYPHGRFYGK